LGGVTPEDGSKNAHGDGEEGKKGKNQTHVTAKWYGSQGDKKVKWGQLVHSIPDVNKSLHSDEERQKEERGKGKPSKRRRGTSPELRPDIIVKGKRKSKTCQESSKDFLRSVKSANEKKEGRHRKQRTTTNFVMYRSGRGKGETRGDFWGWESGRGVGQLPT